MEQMEQLVTREMIESLSRIETEIQALKAKLIRASGKEPPSEIPTQLRILHEIFKAGRIITKQQLYDIAKHNGLDNRGLGGFFSGKKPSLIELAGGRVALTKEGEKKLAFKESEKIYPAALAEEEWTTLSTEAFAEEWTDETDDGLV